MISFALLSAAALFFFIRTELRVKTPILDLNLFRNRLFSAANLSLLFITGTQSAIAVLMPFYLQNVMGFTPTQMGWIIIANSVVIIMVAPIAGGLSDRFGSRLLCSYRRNHHRYRSIPDRFSGSAVDSISDDFSASLNRPGLGGFQFAESKRHLGHRAQE